MGPLPKGHYALEAYSNNTWEMVIILFRFLTPDSSIDDPVHLFLPEYTLLIRYYHRALCKTCDPWEYDQGDEETWPDQALEVKRKYCQALSGSQHWYRPFSKEQGPASTRYSTWNRLGPNTTRTEKRVEWTPDISGHFLFLLKIEKKAWYRSN